MAKQGGHTGTVQKVTFGHGPERRSSWPVLAPLIAVLVGFLIAVPVATFHKFAEMSRSASCGGNEKQLVMGLLQYGQDWDGRLPHPEADWEQAVDYYLKNQQVLICPSDRQPPSYQLAPQLRLVVPKPVTGPDPYPPSATVMLFESEDGQTVAWRHRGHANFGYLDGHIDAWETKDEAPPGYGVP